MTKANICLKSNVFPISGEYPLEDQTFRDKVQDREALRKMFEFVVGRERTDWSYWQELKAKGVKDWQIDSFKNGNYCSWHDNHATPSGIVRSGDNLSLKCRCDQLERCKYAVSANCVKYR